MGGRFWIRGIEYGTTSLKTAAKYALLSFDATMRSNVTVGPPLELLLYRKDSFILDSYRRFKAGDAELGDRSTRCGSVRCGTRSRTCRMCIWRGHPEMDLQGALV